MPKMVCGKCEVEFRPLKNGVTVVEHANFGPYKLWQADEWQCPSCKAKVIAGFGQEAIAEHYQEHFNSYLANTPKPLLRNDYEYAGGL